MRGNARRADRRKREGRGDQNPADEFGRTEGQREQDDNGDRHSNDDD